MRILENNTNEITIQGVLQEEFMFEYKAPGDEVFYKNHVINTRLSGKKDIIPIIISERYIKILESQDIKLSKNDAVQITGEIRSFKKIKNNKTYSEIFVFVDEIIKIKTNKNVNKVTLEGYICNKPTLRKVIEDRHISDVLLAVNKKYKKSYYIPTILWNKNAQFCSTLDIGTKIKIQGRFQSKLFKQQIDGKEIEELYSEITTNRLIVLSEE